MKRESSAIRNTVFTFSIFVVICILLPRNVTGQSESVRGVTETIIKLGAIIDQTGPAAGDVGLPVTEALKIYTRYINDKGGIFGRKVKLIIEDDRYSIPAGIAAFKKLLFKDQIFGLVGPCSVGEAKTLLRQIEQRKIPNIALAPDEAIVNPSRRYVFLPFNLYDDQLGVIFDYIVNDLKSEKIDIIFVYPDVESGKVALAGTRKWAEYFNLDFNTEIVNPGALDATSQAMSIKRRKPTHIILHHGSSGAAMLLRDLKKFGLDIPVYGTLVTCAEDTVRMAGHASKNYIGAHPFSSWYDDLEGPAKLRHITLQYKPGTEKPYRTKIYTAGWVASMILYEAFNRTGKDLNTENWVEAMENIRDLDTGGLSGPVSFSPTNHKGFCHSKLYKADPESGRLVPITEWRKPQEIEKE